MRGVVLVNGPPVAVSDIASTWKNATVHVPVMSNDYDPEGGPIFIAGINGQPVGPGDVVTLASGATVTVGLDGRLLYDPNGKFDQLRVGQLEFESFFYTISDGQLTASANVTVSIHGLNLPPVANDDSESTLKGVPVVVDVRSNDTDPEGDALVVVVLGVDQGGVASVDADGMVRFVPDPDFIGTVTIRYLVEDPSGATDIATLTIQVIEPPNVDPPADPGPEDFSWDSFRNFATGFQSTYPAAQMHFAERALLSREILALAADPIVSGFARPGTEITGRVFDQTGRLIGEVNGRADSGGNWMIQFFHVESFARYRIEVEYSRESSDIYGYLGLNETDTDYQSMQSLSQGAPRPSVPQALNRAPFELLNDSHQQANSPLGLGRSE